MVQIKIGEKEFNFATSLRVIYELKNMLGCKTLQDAMRQVQTLDLDNQIKLLYTAYKCGKNDDPQLTSSEFNDMILDELGIIKISNIISDIVEGFMYAGLSDKEKEEAKNAQRERQEQNQNSAGLSSSDTDTE